MNDTVKWIGGIALAAAVIVGGFFFVWVPWMGHNALITERNYVEASVAEIGNVQKRRADVYPTLVKIIDGSTKFERGTLKEIVELRSKDGQVPFDVSSLMADPAKMKQLLDSQAQFAGLVSRVKLTFEQYPELKSTALFKDFQSQVEGTENRISTARGRYIAAVRSYNNYVERFPYRVAANKYGFAKMAQYTAPTGVESVPEIQFKN